MEGAPGLQPDAVNTALLASMRSLTQPGQDQWRLAPASPGTGEQRGAHTVLAPLRLLEDAERGAETDPAVTLSCQQRAWFIS